jgi:hypothetical protein
MRAWQWPGEVGWDSKGRHGYSHAVAYPFDESVNGLWEKDASGRFAARESTQFYASRWTVPVRAGGTLLIGYFERRPSEYGIAWRVADSLASQGVRCTDTASKGIFAE